MARIRSIKPELRTSLAVADWPREVRYAWVLLWGYLDDHGRGVDDLRLIASDLFPLDRDVTERKIGAWLTKMSTQRDDNKAAPLCRYDVGGRRFLHAVNWTEHQRVAHPGQSRWPPCPEHEQVAYLAWQANGGMTAEPAGQSAVAREPRANPSRISPEDLTSDSRALHEGFTPSRTPARAPAEQGAGSREQGKEQGAGNARDARTPQTPSGQPPTTDTEVVFGVFPGYVDPKTTRGMKRDD